MKIKVNNEIVELSGPMVTVNELLALREVSPNGTAVAVNDRLVPRGKWDTFKIEENDDVTLVSAAFGG